MSDSSHETPRVLRWAIVAFSVAILLAVGASIHLSAIDVNFGSEIYGSPKLWRGAQAIFRVFAYEPRRNNYLPVKAQLNLRDSKGMRTSYNAEGDFSADFRINVPRDLDDDPFLEVSLETASGNDSLRIALRAVDGPGPPQGFFSSGDAALRPRAPACDKDFNVTLFPASGKIVAGLNNRLRGLVTTNNQPLQTTIKIPAAKTQVQSDNRGWFEFDYQPMGLLAPLTFSDGNSRFCSLQVDIAPRQLLLAPADQWAVTPGSQRPIEIRSLPQTRPLFIDMWAGDILVDSITVPIAQGQGHGAITLPAYEGWLQIQSYRDIVAPDATANVQLFWAVSNPNTAWESVQSSLGSMRTEDDIGKNVASNQPHDTAMLALLSRFVPQQVGAPLLRSTVQTRQTEWHEQREKIRGRIHLVYGLLLLLALMLVFIAAMKHRRNVRAQLTQVLHEEAHDSEEPLVAPEILRPSHIPFLVGTLLALILAAYAVYALLTQLRWR